MPKFSDRSQRMLDQCTPGLRRVFEEVVKTYDCIIICGHRTEAAQNTAVGEGTSKVSWPDSKHNSYPSKAVDAAPYFADNPHIRWNDGPAFYLFAGYVMRVAEKMGVRLRYGGDWDGDRRTKDQTFNDLPHFEELED